MHSVEGEQARTTAQARESPKAGSRDCVSVLHRRPLSVSVSALLPPTDPL
jgi:hypothetical protein